MGLLQTRQALLSRLLPDDPPDELAVREGQFHHVVLGSDRVVCLPRTAAAAARLPRRAAVLRALARLDLGFCTPEPLAEGGAPDAGEPPFLVLARIPGAPLASDALRDPATAESAATQYAALLTALATAGTHEQIRAALPHTPRDQWQEFAAGVRAELFPLMSYGGRGSAAWSTGTRPRSATPPRTSRPSAPATARTC